MVKGKIFILTGDVNSGKTSTLSQWAEEYRREDYAVGGVIAPANWRKGRKISYDIIDLKSGERHFIASSEPIENAIKYGRFWFSNIGIAIAESAIMHLDELVDVGMIDEIGPLELKGKGLARGLYAALGHPPKKLILVVRKSLVEKISQAFSITSYHLLTTDSPKP